MKKNKVIIISGPTATGKTDLSLELAKQFNGEVVNFDSLLFYKELNIGTAKPTDAELAQVKHHMVNTHSIKDAINAAEFARLATPIIIDCHQREKAVILSGGSGFYLQALTEGMYDSITTPTEVTERSNTLYAEEGIDPFIAILKQIDTPSFERYHENDHYRIRRAVEHFWTTKTPFSDARKQMPEKKKKSPTVINNWDILHIHLDIPKEEHYNYILSRTDRMVANGLVEEVKSLLESISSGLEKPIQSIGYKETIDYINDKFESIEDYKERLSINTRRLAKSQRTWFKKLDKLCYNPLLEKNKIVVKCEKFLRDNT